MLNKLYIKTYGCQMNVYDSIRIQELLEPHGYQTTNNIDDASLIILNTCHIREKAAEKVYSELGRIKKLYQKNTNIKKTIIVAGCVAQAEGDEIFNRANNVDIVVGPGSYHSIPELLHKSLNNQKKVIELDFEEEKKFDNLPESNHNQGVSAFVSIQEGCDKFCAFCVVPYTRGSEFSRPVEQVYREVLNNVSSGTKEVTLLGQNVNAYHGIGPDNSEYNLAKLINSISKIKGLERIRYTTSHPRDVNDELIDIHGNEEKLMPFLHLPVQSGSDSILKSMNRKHTRDDYFRIIDKFRSKRKDMVFSSDFIVGFPGETDKDFDDTLDLVKKVRFAQCYSFKYSKRPGTPASIIEQVPEHIKNERLQVLQKELYKQQKEYNDSFIGSVQKILIDKQAYEGQVSGQTPYMQKVHLDQKNNIIGNIVDVKITKSLTHTLTGIAL